MPIAQSLRQLLEIRKNNEGYLRSIPGCLGTAVGFRYLEHEGRFDGEESGEFNPANLKPAILVFVIEKIPAAALTRATLIPEKFFAPPDLECYSDVIVGKPPELIQVDPPTTGFNAHIIHDLHNKDLGIIGGIPIEGGASVGTAGVVLESEGKLGILTNFHVAGFEDSQVFRLGPVFEFVGTTTRSIPRAPHTPEFSDDLESFSTVEHPFDHRVDIGFVELNEAGVEKAKPWVYALTQPLGAPFELDLDHPGFSPVGRNVVGVGQKLGRQKGRILAYGYEWRSSFTSDQWYATDYLIKGEGEFPFAGPGDSGKLVVTNDIERRPIALLWGGERHFFSNVPAQATCAYATEIGLVLKLLGDAKINWQPQTCTCEK